MIDRNQFMETLLSLSDYAQENGGVLEKAEIEESFEGVELTAEQYDLIYRYLFEKKIRVRGVEQGLLWENAANTEPEDADVAKTAADAGLEREEDNRYLQIYLDEIKELPVVTESERLAWMMRLLDGEKSALEPVFYATLPYVVEWTGEYRGQGALLEDLIQEGNQALWVVLNELTGKKTQEDPLEFVRETVKFRIASYLDEMTEGDESSERVVAKMGLLHEAAKEMAKENGELPTVAELAEYAHISEEEVRALARLSKDVDFVKSVRNE